MGVDLNQRVCPECGAPAGEAPFCANCGVNLSTQPRLPTRAEWEALQYSGGPLAGTTAGGQAGRRRWLWALGGALAVAVVALVALVLAGDSGNTKTYTVPSEAMEPTYDVGDKLSVNLDAYDGGEPDVGDIVVFHPPTGVDNGGVECGMTINGQQPNEVGMVCPKPTGEESRQTFLKRIVAGPGDTLSIKEGHPVVNGIEKKDEPYVNPCGGDPYVCELPQTITIPPGHYFMLGDNRGASDDSRFWGPVPAEWILGKVE